ncbi:MAG: hypothetical protein JRI46_10225 [Deltaproteobacteria bacterium]|nr:hypothetical protein [Deltaproteobacteria bacterium]
MGKRFVLRSLLVIFLLPLFYTPAYSASVGPCCPQNQELRYLLQPPSKAEFKYQIHYETFFSSCLGKVKNFFLLLPPDFDLGSSQRYPLLILLHGYNFHRNGAKGTVCDPKGALDLLCREEEEEFHWLLLEDIAPIAWAMMDAQNKNYRDLEENLKRRFQELARYGGLRKKDYRPSEIATSLVEHNLHPNKGLDDPFQPIRKMIILLPDGDNSFYTDEDEGKRLFPPTGERGGCDAFSPVECLRISRFRPQYMKPGALGRYESYILELMEYLRKKSPLGGKILPPPYTGIGGFSMGGYGALKIALRRPQLFSSVSSQSGVVDIELLNNKLVLKTLMPEFLEVFGHLEPMALPSSSTINEAYRREHNPLRLLREGKGRGLRDKIYVDYGAGERLQSIMEGNKKLDAALGGASRMISVQPYNGKAAHNHLFWRSRLGNVLEHHSRCLK